MSSLTNINNNSSVVNVGRTTPLSPGPQPPEKSIPVVVSNTAELAIPVIEQNKIQSEVALSMLGIPRGEVALGIFSDVNTYDVNPGEWSSFPQEYVPGYGVKHLPQEAGALVQAPKNEYSVLSSKRFFRYQPGRVSSATFGVKSTTSPSSQPDAEIFDLNPAIRKYGIFDKFDGYYWEVQKDGKGDNFSTVRRTQSLLYYNPVTFSNQTSNNNDYRVSGKPASDPSPEPNLQPRSVELITDQRFVIAKTAFDNVIAAGGLTASYLNGLSTTDKEKCLRDMDFAISAYLLDLQYGGDAHSIVNATTYRTALLTANAEQAVHRALRDQIKLVLENNAIDIEVRNKIDVIAEYTIQALDQNPPSGSQIAAADYGLRDKITTIFSIYKRYLAYLVSESFTQGLYTPEIKYKCYRDIGYIVDGYARDLAGGGNAGTVYNMQNFYFNDILRVTTDFGTNNDVISFHIKAHTLLKKLISKNSLVTNDDNPGTGWDMGETILKGQSFIGFVPVFTLFGIDSATTEKFNELADDLIANFTEETRYDGRMEFGDSAQFGDLVIYRDGLLHIHAAVFDPSLLKAKRKIRVKVNTDNTLTVSEGEFVVGQNITFYGDILGLRAEDDGNNAILDSDGNPVGKTYAVKQVKGPKSNIISLYDINDVTKTALTFTQPAGTDGLGEFFIEPNVPFIFPKDYITGTNERGSTATATTWRKPDGAFPYMYTNSTGVEIDSNGNPRDEGLPTDGDTSSLYKLGFINTAIDTTSVAINILREQIDQVNFLYNNWIKQNVDPTYYSVYEYRVPRSRFSTDKLDGKTRNVVYSDVATGEFEGSSGVVVRPGQSVTKNEDQVVSTSIWDLDFTKVTMLKIEFSWYGAVGALFLAYVPVGNGEARWVRVHHLRASNQLKISSLGNATLPITYLTYGGGDQYRFGIENTNQSSYTGPLSDFIVKYGASYYIDGGDRGTVRLYSHTNLIPTNVYGNEYTVSDSPPVTKDSDSIGNYFIIPGSLGPADRTYFMKAQVVSNSILDQNITVEWIDGNKIYTNTPLVGTNNIKLIAKRSSAIFGLKAKENIFNNEGIGIRNRVQVYPTKLSAGNFSNNPLKLAIVKTPVFQTTFNTTGSFTLTAPYTITPSQTSLTINPSVSGDYLERDGEYVYGWFRANIGTVFGKLSRQGGDYYFTLLEVYSGTVILLPNIPFLKDGNFAFNGDPVSGIVDVDVEKERLSSVKISNTIQSPIPNTGTEITSFFVNSGSEQFDLLSYFDYNKDYLSYPLTDEVESIYIVSSNTDNSEVSASRLNVSITWEEQ